jgi:hypothetical protein
VDWTLLAANGLAGLLILLAKRRRAVTSTTPTG